MRYLLGAFMALFLCPAWAATYYIDAAAGNGGTGTEGSPFNTWSDVTLAANDTVYIKGYIPDAITVTSTSGVTIDNWPGFVGGVDCASTIAIGITITSSDENTLNDLDVKDCLTHGVLHDLSSATSADYYVNRVTVTRTIGPQTTSGNFKVGTCFWAGVSGSPNSSTQNRVTYTDTIAADCVSHGYNAEQETYARYVRAITRNAGREGLHGAHGFSVHPRVTVVSGSSGWTQSGSSTVYIRNRSFSGDVEQRMCSRGTGGRCLIKQAADDTTLAVGEWTTWQNLVTDGTITCTNGAGCLAVNFGAAPASYSEVRWSRWPQSAIYEDTLSEYTNEASGTGAEGHGYDCDDLGVNCLYRRAIARYNEDGGFYMRQAGTPIYEACIAYRNDGVGFTSLESEGATYRNTVAALNGSNGYRGISDFEYDVTYSNTVAAFNSGRGYGMDPQSAAEVTATSAHSHGNGSADENVTASITSNPRFVGGDTPSDPNGFRLRDDSPLRRAGTFVAPVHDFGNRLFSTPPSIGAWEVASGDQAVRTTANDRTAAANRTTAADRSAR